eukprot:COSAG06_NODE_3443_length_5343_cov_2.163806_3_plen_76_part_00
MLGGCREQSAKAACCHDSECRCGGSWRARPRETAAVATRSCVRRSSLATAALVQSVSKASADTLARIRGCLIPQG